MVAVSAVIEGRIGAYESYEMTAVKEHFKRIVRNKFGLGGVHLFSQKNRKRFFAEKYFSNTLS